MALLNEVAFKSCIASLREFSDHMPMFALYLQEATNTQGGRGLGSRQAKRISQPRQLLPTDIHERNMELYGVDLEICALYFPTRHDQKE